ncbi:hypothetical protein ZYGR_0H01120 [Zygosaccharomyces rouxii]|uniref:ZYRO0B06534p n=2 Tax=Zygosaccharomyces rouxii TaxID=4956 RepID=C5DR92_ZYGRC|nr:uncharacterized protein ZYRO0B06534g [Zygosaccharomyces rouxii]GAV47271.1 hypothetical protein ZYGR_0H01120 [Zygosaccharomyces rouxii]CAR26303.1 ZYRO0B06534p [Zygosaccharomyces rouxii]
MNVAATVIKSELMQVAKGRKSEAKVRIRRYLQHAGFTPGDVRDLPPRPTSEISLDTEMLFFLISMNELDILEENISMAKLSSPNNEAPRKLRLFSSIYLKIKRGLFHHHRGHQRFNRPSSGSEDEGDAAEEELDEKMELLGFENGSDSYKGDSPSSIQTVIQNDSLVMITPPGFPSDPKPTTNILKIM